MSLRRDFFAGLAAANDTTQPILWLDAKEGFSADMSTWKARLGNYTAVQTDPSRRFIRMTDSRPNWVRCSLETTMKIPNVHLNCPGVTILAAVEINEPQAMVGQSVASFAGGTIYSYNGGVEFFCPEFDNGSYGSNPTIPLRGYDYAVVGGDAVVGRYPASRSFVNNLLNTNYNRMAQRVAKFGNSDFNTGSMVGRLRHLLVFNYVLSDERRAYWATRLLNSTP